MRWRSAPARHRLLWDAAVHVAEVEQLIDKLDRVDLCESILDRLRDRMRTCAVEIAMLSALNGAPGGR